MVSHSRLSQFESYCMTSHLKTTTTTDIGYHLVVLPNPTYQFVPSTMASLSNFLLLPVVQNYGLHYDCSPESHFQPKFSSHAQHCVVMT